MVSKVLPVQSICAETALESCVNHRKQRGHRASLDGERLQVFEAGPKEWRV